MKVRCINITDRNDDALKLGKIYTVLGESNDIYRIRPRKQLGFSHFAKWRFQIVEAFPKPKIIR
jgi:hypothetical protein